jgi:hypothetical protein
VKVCEQCGREISTRDADNRCEACEELSGRTDQQAKAKRRKARQRRQAMRDAMESIGLVRVRGAMGGVYYE